MFCAGSPKRESEASCTISPTTWPIWISLSRRRCSLCVCIDIIPVPTFSFITLICLVAFPFSLGLLHGNHGGEQADFLLEALRNAGNNEVVMHGAALGLGLSALATSNHDLVDTLTNSVLFQDNAVAGEAAGYAMGLVCLGSGEDQALTTMLTYSHQTKHEKIIRMEAAQFEFVLCFFSYCLYFFLQVVS